MKRALLITN